MTRRLENPQSRTDRARKADTPWRARSIKRPDNRSRQRQALKRMTDFEARFGITQEEFLADQAEQRARVRARYGLDKTAGVPSSDPAVDRQREDGLS